MRKKIKNLLITCAGGSSPIYFANKMKQKFNIFLVDGSNQTVAPYLGFPFKKVPFGNDPSYSNEIESIIKKWNIDCIVPGSDAELLSIKRICLQNNSLLAIIPSANFIVLCLNKKKLMETLAKFGISHLMPFKDKKQVRYPAFAKPIFGRGSRQAHKIDNQRQLEGYLKLYNKKFNEVLVQPYIEGEEYTVSVIVNNLNKIIGIVPKKIILKKGITKAAVTEYNPLIDNIGKKIVDKFKPNGPFNIQLKVHNNRVYIFEINPRLSTTAVLTDKAFGNEIELYIKYYNQNRIITPPSLKENIFLFRFDENYFRMSNEKIIL
jgi:carbamoyl-phosphate synthase large subunit